MRPNLSSERTLSALVRSVLLAESHGVLAEMKLDWDNWSSGHLASLTGRIERDLEREVEQAVLHATVPSEMHDKAFCIVSLRVFVARDGTRRLGAFAAVHYIPTFVRSDSPDVPPSKLLVICAYLVPESAMSRPGEWIAGFHEGDDDVITGDGGLGFLRWLQERIELAVSACRVRTIVSVTGWDSRRSRAYGAFLTRQGWLRDAVSDDNHCLLVRHDIPASLQEHAWTWDALPQPEGGWPQDAGSQQG